MQKRKANIPETPVEDTPRDFKSWELRLKEERTNLLQKTINLKAALDDPDFKLNHEEWSMLMRQYSAMREYLQVLTDRCKYYGLIQCGDLGIQY